MEQPEQTTPEQPTIKGGRPLTMAQKRFYASDTCAQARVLLQALADNPDYNTDPSRYTDNLVTFVERHLYHLSSFPQTNLHGYISNLRLMTSTKRTKPTDQE